MHANIDWIRLKKYSNMKIKARYEWYVLIKKWYILRFRDKTEYSLILKDAFIYRLLIHYGIQLFIEFSRTNIFAVSNSQRLRVSKKYFGLIMMNRLCWRKLDGCRIWAIRGQIKVNVYSLLLECLLSGLSVVRCRVLKFLLRALSLLRCRGPAHHIVCGYIKYEYMLRCVMCSCISEASWLWWSWWWWSWWGCWTQHR